MTSRSRPPWGPCRAPHGKPNTFSSYTTRRDTAGRSTLPDSERRYPVLRFVWIGEPKASVSNLALSQSPGVGFLHSGDRHTFSPALPSIPTLMETTPCFPNTVT